MSEYNTETTVRKFCQLFDHTIVRCDDRISHGTADINASVKVIGVGRNLDAGTKRGGNVASTRRGAWPDESILRLHFGKDSNVVVG